MGGRVEKPKHESTRTIEELSSGEVKKDGGVKDIDGLCDKSKRFTANYDDHTVRMLMKGMLEEGYRNKKKMKKTMAEFFDGFAEKAWKIYKIRCRGRGWRDKYEKYRREVNRTGWDGDEVQLDLPAYYPELCEMESRAARNDPPNVLSTEMNLDTNGFSGGIVTSTRKRLKKQANERILKREERQAERHDELLRELKRSNDAKEKMVALLEKFLDTSGK